MAIVVTQEGAQLLVQWILQVAPVQLPVVHLLGSPHALAHDDDQGGLEALELSVSGYTPQQLGNPQLNWQLTGYPDGVQATYAVLTFTFGAACTVYGYWLASSDGLTSLWGETLPSPAPIPVGGGSWQLIPYFYLASQPFTQGECG